MLDLQQKRGIVRDCRDAKKKRKLNKALTDDGSVDQRL